jgi:hypothetical protein
MRFTKRLLSVFTAIALLGCAKYDIPHDFRLEVADVILSTDPAKVTVRLVSEERKVTTGQAEYPLVIKPDNLAKLGPLNTLTCLKSGDGTVELTLGNNHRTAPLKCRLVEKVDASNVGRVELKGGPFKPNIQILGKGGIVLDSVELLLSSKNTGVLFPKGSELVPKEVGTATVIARAGQVSKEFTVDVVRKVDVEALPLEQDKKVFFSLEPGKYELALNLPEEKRLTAEWRSAPYCNYAATSKKHVSICVLRAKGGVVFDSPAYLLSGKAMTSTEGVTLYEIP